MLITEDLNAKISAWCGFGKYYKPDATRIRTGGKLPDFLHSMNAHIKWTIPKLKEQEYMVRVQYGIHYGDDMKPTSTWTAYAHIYDTSFSRKRGLRNFEQWGICSDEGDIGEAMCTALCRAIEKLIDAEEKK